MKRWGVAGYLLLLTIATAGRFLLPLNESAVARLAAGAERPARTFELSKAVQHPAGVSPGRAGAVLVSVQPISTTVSPGQLFTTTIEISALTSALTAFQFDLAYDESLIQPSRIFDGNFLKAPGRHIVCPQAAHPAPGVIRYTCASSGETAGPTGSGVLAQLSFAALNPGKSPLTLSGLQLAGPGVPPPPIVTGGQGAEVTVLSTSTGNTIYLPVIVRSGSTQTTFGPQPASPKANQAGSPPLMPGMVAFPKPLANGTAPQRPGASCYPTDLDCDHDVDESDLSLSAGTWNCAVGDLCYGAGTDLDNDGVVDAFDLAWIGNDYDVTPPTPSIISPSERAVTGVGDLRVSGSVTDVHTVTAVTVNDVPASLNGNNFSATIPLVNGNQVLNVTATDELGASGFASRVIAADGEGPAIRINSPLHRQAFYSLTPTISISYTDFYTGVNVASLSAQITSESGAVTDVIGELNANESGARGQLDSPLAGDASYTLTVSLADRYGNWGNATASFYLPQNPGAILQPDEADGAGWVSGAVFDSASCNQHLTTCAGLPGASVTLAFSNSVSISGTVITGPDGFFTFPVEETAHYWLRVEKAGYTYGQRVAEIVRERNSATNEIYLTPLDPAQTACDETGCSHVSSDGILELEIPAGAITTGEVVTASATYFEHVEFLPSGDLPEGTWETYAFNLGGASEITFTQPITVRVQNSRGFSPGTPIPLGYWNQRTMRWEHAGIGQVDLSGSWVVMTVTHFSNFDCNDPVELDDLDDDEDDESNGRRRRRRRDDDDGDDDQDPERDPCDDAGRSGCYINLKSGILEEEIRLPSFSVLGQEMAPVLAYNTDRVKPVRVIDVSLSIDVGSTTQVDHIGYELYIGGEKTRSFTISATMQTTQTRRYRFLWDGRDAHGDLLPAGVYPYAVRFKLPYRAQYCFSQGMIFGNPPDCINGATGVWEDVNRDVWVRGAVELDPGLDSPFGAGWTLSGLQRLFEDEAGGILIRDDLGLSEFYLPSQNRLADRGGSSLPLLSPHRQAEEMEREARLSPPEPDATPKPFPAPQAAPDWTEEPVESPAPIEPLPPAYWLDEPDVSMPESGAAGSPSTTWRILAPATLTVSGDITQTTTWDLIGSPYLVAQDVIIKNDALLTIEAGVEVRFNNAAGLYVEAGALQAIGTPTKTITFTSNANPAAAGDWEGIFFGSNSDDALSRLEHVSVTYAGQQVYWQNQFHRTGIGIYRASPTIEHTTVRHSYGQGLKGLESTLTLSHNTFENNAWSGLYLQEVSLTLSDSSLSHNGSEGLWFTNYATAITGTLTGNTFAHNNQEGMEIYANASMTGTIESNLISENGLDGMVIRPGNTVVTPIISSNTFISNTWNAIHLVYDNGSGLPVASGNVVYGNGRLNGVAVAGSLAYSTSWPANYSLPLGIDANLIINSGTELTVEPGAEILSGYSGRLVVHGALRAIGTPSQPITLTSYSPWWNGINYAQQSDDSRNRLEHVKLLNAGITIYDASPAFHAITVRGSQSYGLQAQSTSLLITGSTFESNGASGVSMNDSDLTMSNCTLRQNNGDGLELTVSGQLLAPALTSNTFISNTGYGILVRYSDGGGLPAVSGNLMSGNDDGDVVALRGTLAYSVTWPASYEHGLFVDGNLTVESGAELTVEPGLEIQFEDRMGLFIHGALRAIGTPTQPITFTNGSPPWGGWAGVFFDDDSDDTRSRLEHVTIHYAGYNSYWHNAIGTGIGVYDASPTIRNTTVRNSDGAGFWARNTAITLTHNLFAENDYDGIYLWNAELNLTASSVISNFGYAIRVRDMTAAGLPVVSGNSISGNTDLDGVGVEGNLSYSTTWPSSYNLPLVVADDLLVESGVDLTLDPGTVMLFDYDAGLFVNGQLHAVGTSVAPISFTSAETPPGIGDWDGIFLEGGDGLTRLAYCDISYAGNRVWWEGRYWYASLALLANDAEIFHCTIRQSGWSGMETFDSAPLFNHNVIRNNYRGVVVDGTTVFELLNSQIFSNTQAGLQNKTGLVQDARYNWWGDATGPYHPLLNPTGLGDQVSDDVLFDPWLDIPPTHLEIALNRTETDSTLLIYNSEDGTYTRQLLDGTRVSFDANGLHQYTLDPAGNQTAYTYHADESLAKMAFTPAGATAPSHIWSFVYAGGKLASIVDPAGEVTLFDVDEHGHLVEVTDGDAKTRRFYYDDDGLMTQQQDEAGQITSFSYDEYGAIRSETLPQRNIVDAVTGQPVLYQEVRSHTPSNTAYPLINDSPVGDPDAPAPPVPLAADLIDRVSSASGMESGHTNRWGSWTDRTDSLGRTTTYTHDDKNNLTRVTFPDGSCTQYGYDVVGNMLSKTVMEPASCALPLASVGPAAGFSWSYTYESRFNHVKTATDPRGNSTTYVYDYEEGAGEAGNLIRIEYPAVEDENGTTASPVEHFTYNSWGLLETETDPAGVVTRYIYTQGTPDEAYGQPGALFADGVTPVPGLLTQRIRDEGGLHVTSTTKDFDAHGYPLTSLGPRGSSPLACTSCATTAGEDLADQGSITHYRYDARGRLLTEENGLGIVTKYEYSQWDELLRKTEDYTPDGITGRNIVTTYSYDPMGRLLSERIVADGIVHEMLIAYDAAGNPISKRNGNGHTVTYSYDANRQLIGETDPLGFTTSYSYTMAGELTHITLPDGVTHRVRYDGYGHLLQETVDEGGLNLVTSYTYDANGNLLTETDPAGIVTCYTYDALNRMTSMRRDCGGLDLTLTYAYDVAGNLARLIDERGIETVNSYDALGRLTSVRHDAGGLDLETTYDVDPAGNLIRVTDERGLVTEFEYDALNRQISMTQDPTGLNLTTLTTYDRLGNQDSMHAPNGVVTFWETNAFGRPVRIVEDVGGRSAETITTYDNNLNLLTITDANGYSTHYSYDERDLQTQIRYADGTTVDHGYYPDGMLAWRINQAGDRVDFFYNGANQLEHKTYPGGATQTLAYNLAGHPTNLGQTMNGHTTAFSLAYNPVGHVVSSTQSLDGLSWTTSYTKAYASGTATTTYPSGVTVSVTEDAFGRPAQIGRDGYAVATYAYDDISGTISLTYTNGLVTRIESDSLGRVTRVEAAPLSDYRYGYDAAGNRSFIQRWHESGNPADVYAYDSLAQLTDVWYGADATDPAGILNYDRLSQFTYDDGNNRLVVGDDGNSVDYLPNDGLRLTNAMNRYQQVAARPFIYDQDGNLLNDGISSYGYDFLDRQISVSAPGTDAEYVYDLLGQRVAKIVNGVSTYYLYNINSQVIEERDASDNLQSSFIYGGGLDEPLTMRRGGVDYSYHQDALGNVTELSDESGSLVERYVYDVYGAPHFFDSLDNPLPASAIGNPYLFTGRRYDPESENYYYRNRMFDPELGRFLQMDPLGYVDGLNLYAYVGNNPTNVTDPDGLNPNGWLCRNVGQHLGSFGRGLFCQGPGMACRSACQYRGRLERGVDPCDDDNFDMQRCLDECQDQVDRVPRPSPTPSIWYILRNGFRVATGR